MKELIIVRHAKSDWGAEFLKDIDRPLSERGYTDAYFMSKWFVKNQPRPDKLISSTATRALSTALIFSRELEMDVFLEKKIYESSVKTILNLVRNTEDSVNSIMLFGHNPTFTEVCNTFIKDFYLDNLPTCGITGMKFSVTSWKDIQEKTAISTFHEFPKNFKNTD